MKVTLSVIFAIAFAASCLAIPTPDKKDEVEIIPLEKNYGDKPIVDTGVISWGNPFSNPFDGFFENIEGIMTRMRQQMETLLKSFPVRGSNSSEIPEFPALGADFVPLPIGSVELGKPNITSITKVIDGHKVVINDTRYTNKDGGVDASFFVRVIDIKPESGEFGEASPSGGDIGTPTARVDSSEKESTNKGSSENEITKSREVSKYDNLEPLEELDISQNTQKTAGNSAEWEEVQPVYSIEDNAIHSDENQRPVDLTRDIYVNELLANRGAPINPDAEILFVPKEMKKTRTFQKYMSPR